MAENMTLDEAVKIMEGNTSELSDAELGQINETFYNSFTNGGYRDQKTQDAADIALALAESRIDALNGQDNFDPADLDSVISLANSISSFSNKGDIAKAVAEKAQKQKAELEAQAKPAQENIGSEKAETANDDIVVDEAAAAPQTNENVQKEESRTFNNPEMFMEAAREASKAKEELVPPATAEEEKALDNTEQKVEKLPDQLEAVAAFDKEYGIDTLTPEQAAKNSEWMERLNEVLNRPGSEKEQYDSALKEERELLDALQIVDEKGKEVSEDKAKKSKATILEAADLEAETLTVASSRAQSYDEFVEDFIGNSKDSMRKAIVSTAFAENLKGADGKPLDPSKLTKEQLGEAYARAAAGDKQNPPKAGVKSIADYAGMVSAEINNVKEAMKTKVGNIPAVQKVEAKLKKFDEKMSGKYGKYWDYAKRAGKVIAKRGKGVAIYTAVGATMGPVGLGLLAVKSGYDTYKGFKNAAAKEGKSFGQYAMEHKLDVGLGLATAGLSAVGSALGMGIGGEELAGKIKPALKTATQVLAVAPKAIKTATYGIQLFAQKKGWMKGNSEETKARFDASKKELFDATVGIIAGSMINNAMHGGEQSAADDKTAETQNAPEQTSQTAAVDGITAESENVQSAHNLQSMTPQEMATTLEQMGLSPDRVDSMSPEAMQHYIMTHPEDFQSAQMMMQDKDNDGIVDSLDADHGQGWATANETQLNRAFDADPRGINEILNDGKWHSSAELHSMMENGEFSEEQLKAIHVHASQTFDENGHIVDPELKAYYNSLAEQQAQAEPSKEQTHEEYVQEVGARAAEVSIEAMTHDTLSASGLMPGEQLADLEGLIAGAKQSGDFSQVDAFMAGHGIDPNSEAGKGIQDYINAAKGLSATGGEDPATFFNQGQEESHAPESSMPSHQQMHDLALKTQEAYKNGMPMGDAFAQTLQAEVAAGNMTLAQAEGAIRTVDNLMEENKDNPDKMLKQWIKGSEKAAEEEIQMQQEAALKANMPSNGEMLNVLLNARENYENGASIGAAVNQSLSAEVEAGRLTVEQASAVQQTIDKEWQADNKNTDRTFKDMIKTYETEAKKDFEASQAAEREAFMAAHPGVENVKGVDKEPTVYNGEEQLMQAQVQEAPVKGLDEAPVYQEEKPAQTVGQEEKGSEGQTSPENTLESKTHDFVSNIENNHGLENPQVVSNHSWTRTDNTGTVTSLSMFLEGSNGYAMTAQSGGESFVIDEKGVGHFRTGNGDEVRDMNYGEAKEFLKSIEDNTLHPENIKYGSIYSALYDIDKEALAKENAAVCGVEVNAGAQVVAKDSGVLVTDDKNILMTTESGAFFGCSVDEKGKVEVFKGLGGQMIPMEGEERKETLEIMSRIAAAQNEQGNSSITKAMSSELGQDRSDANDKSAAQKIQALRGNAPAEHAPVRQTTVNVNTVHKGKEMA